MLATLTLHLHLPTCSSLKEKRSRLKPLLSRLHREFNISVAEMDLNDQWQEALIACAMVNRDSVQLQRSMQAISQWLAANWPDGMIVDEILEVI